VDSSEQADLVVAQFPRAGASVERGSRVRVNVSRGPKPKPQRAVPDVTGQDEGSATSQLEAAGFTVETSDQESSDPSEDGVVLDQDPAGGTSAPPRSVITLYVGRYTG